MSSYFTRIDVAEPSIFVTKTLFRDDFDLTLDLLNPNPFVSDYDAIADLVTIRRSPLLAYRRVDSLARRHLHSLSGLELAFDRRVGSVTRYNHLQSLFDRVSALELALDRQVGSVASYNRLQSLADRFSSLGLARVGSATSYDRLQSLTDSFSAIELACERRVESVTRYSHLESLADRLSTLELSFDDLANGHLARSRKHAWEVEIKHPDWKYKLKAEIKGKKCGKVERDYKWMAEIKDGDDVTRSYMFKTSSGSEKKEKGEKKKKPATRVVDIDEMTPDHRAVVLRQAFAKRAGALERCRGKRKELSPQDAAMMIQMTFKAYLVRRSQALRALRELAVAKAKLKELRVLFNSFAYRRRVARDAEERQRFTEKIIVVLLTVDSIQGVDVMVRAAKRSMIDELEAMLDVVDPQPAGKARLVKRRTFDMPDGTIQRELAAGVAEVVQMLDQENGTFEACL